MRMKREIDGEKTTNRKKEKKGNLLQINLILQET